MIERARLPADGDSLRRRHWRWIVSLVAMLLVVAVLQTGQQKSRGTAALVSATGNYERPPERNLGQGLDPSGEYCTKSILTCRRGACLLRHYPDAEPLYNGPPTGPLKPGDFAQVVCDSESPWFVGCDSDTSLTTFNCATFAIGDAIGLTPNDWLGLQPESGFANPMQVVLASFYKNIRTYDVTAQGIQEFTVDLSLRDGDVLCMYDSSETMTHVGKIVEFQGTNHVVSKLGVGPILHTNLQFLTRGYPTKLVKVYRLISAESSGI